MRWFTKKEIGLEALTLEPGKVYVVMLKRQPVPRRQTIIRYLRRLEEMHGIKIVLCERNDFEFITVPKGLDDKPEKG